MFPSITRLFVPKNGIFQLNTSDLQYLAGNDYYFVMPVATSIIQIVPYLSKPF